MMTSVNVISTPAPETTAIGEMNKLLLVNSLCMFTMVCCCIVVIVHAIQLTMVARISHWRAVLVVWCLELQLL